MERLVLVDQQVFVVVGGGTGQSGRIAAGRGGLVERGGSQVDRVGAGRVVVDAIREAVVRGRIVPEPRLESAAVIVVDELEGVTVRAILVALDRTEHLTGGGAGTELGLLMADVVVGIGVNLVLEAPAAAEFG